MKKVLFKGMIFSVIFLVTFLTTSFSAQPSEELIISIIQDSVLSGNVEEVSFSDDGRSIRSIRGELSESFRGNLADAGRAYILNHKRLLGIPSDFTSESLVVVRNDEVDGVTHLSFGFEIEGLKIYQNQIDLHISRDGKIRFLTGSFPAFNETVNRSNISDKEALRIAQNAIGIKRNKDTGTVTKYFAVHNEKLVPALLVSVSALEPLGDYNVLINGNEGTVIDIENEMKFFNGGTGKGSVYTIHPHKSSVTVEPLPHMIDGTLKGKYVEVLNEDFPAASSTDGTFIYDPEDTHFDEVNVYYHINRIHDFFSKYGFTKLDRPLKAMVHNETKYDSAFYSPKHDIICFGDGNRCNDFAKEDSVIYHEYAHAVLQHIIVLTYKRESGALNEGQADYFACSFTDDAKIGEYVESKTYSSCIRNIDNQTHYPEATYGDVHVMSLVWSASLWDIRKALGAEITDKLVFKSHYYLKSPDCKFFEGYQALLAADKDLFGGANKSLIRQIFIKRGIADESSNYNVLDMNKLSQIQKFYQVHSEIK
ncbi:MAG: M36 family metallopeptidase [Candidatus Riflebacteria bacterium]|nr:M36 family metallopeptidase [Candidatus Riflebacteria bacterium]